MLTALAIGGGVLVIAWWFARNRSARRDDAKEGKRFVLRVAMPRGKTLVLGTSVETADPPSSDPTLIASEVAVVDDSDQVVVIPAGQVLRVRAFEGAVRKALDTVTTASGTGRRYSFEVEAGRRFWILDAPGWRGCLGTPDPTRRKLPPRAEGYELTTRLPPEPELDEHGVISVTMADLTIPLWMHGLEGPEEWLLGARATAEPMVAIAAFTDPHAATRSGTAEVGSTCFQLLDTLWLETTARATAGVPVVVSRARIFTPEPLRAWEDLETWRQRFHAGASFVWGAGRASLESEGFDVQLRSARDPVAVELVGPLAAIRRRLVEELAARGIARVAARPVVCTRIKPLPVAVDGAYATIVDLLFLLILAHPNNQALPEQDPPTQRRIVDFAKELAELAPESEVGALTWIVAAIYAHGCGGLSTEQRAAALAFVRGRAREDDPIRRLAPAIFYRLGETGEAASACNDALAWCETTASAYRGTVDPEVAAYRAWIEKVRTKTLEANRQES